MKDKTLKYKDFVFLKKQGAKIVGQFYIVLHCASRVDLAWAVVASKKMGNACRRNYHKRCVREIVRNILQGQQGFSHSFMIICLNKPSSFQEKSRDIKRLLKKLVA